MRDESASPPGRGPLGVKVSDIVDGTSKTIMATEREIKGLAAQWVGVGNAATDYGPGGTCAILARAGFNQNWDLFDLYAADNRGKGMSSPHSGESCQYLFADGSVAVVSTNTAERKPQGEPYNLLQQLANRADRWAPDASR